MNSPTSNLKKALGSTLVFMLVEAIGGYFANSLALMSDAAHMGSDAAALGLSLFTVWMSSKPSTPRKSFGYQRLEILGAMVSALAIWLVAGFLVFESVNRLTSPPVVNGPVVFVVATLGLIINLWNMRLLHNHHHHSLGIKAAYLHLITDTLGSVGAIIAGILLWWTGWQIVDPIVTLLFSALMIFSTWDLLKESLDILMEAAPSHIDPVLIKKSLTEIPGVNEVHDLHIWSVNSKKLALSVHIVSEHASPELLNQAQEIIRTQFKIIHTTIQLEHPSFFDHARCFDCEPSAGDGDSHDHDHDHH